MEFKNAVAFRPEAVSMAEYLVSKTNRTDKMIVECIKGEYPYLLNTDLELLQLVTDVRRKEHQERLKKSNEDYQSGKLGWE